MTDKKTITLKQLIDNEPVELEVPGVGIIKVREPTIGDRIEARNEAMKLPEWDKMDALERANEITTRMILKTIVEPKIEDINKLKLYDWLAIMDVVLAWQNKRRQELENARRSLIEDFLGVKKERNL